MPEHKLTGVFPGYCCKYDFETIRLSRRIRNMRITNLLFWVQENKLSEKFYKKLGFEITQSDNDHSIVSLHGFNIDLVSMRDEDTFAKDALSAHKGQGMYVYIQVEDVDEKHAALVADGLTPRY